MIELNKIHQMDALSGLKLIPDNSIDCCVTSPPYFGLRQYLKKYVTFKPDLDDKTIKQILEELNELGIKLTKE